MNAPNMKIFELNSKRKIAYTVLERLLPDVETALFFAKVYDLPREKLTELLSIVKPGSSVIQELQSGVHSTELQDYLVETVPDVIAKFGVPTAAPQGDILPELWRGAELTVAESIAEVADKLFEVLASLPGKTGTMTFEQLAKVNKQRPTLGQFTAVIKHKATPKGIVVFDVSGSMSKHTVKTIVDDVVALSYESNSSLAIVSNNAFYWNPNTFGSQDVLDAAEYGGTHYESLADIFQENWDFVVTVADYDSSGSAKEYLAACKGRVKKLIDISLVNRPTFLAECLGQLADEVHPVLIAQSNLT